MRNQFLQYHALVDDGSFDPDWDFITLEQIPPGPYGLGIAEVNLAVTENNAFDECSAIVTLFLPGDLNYNCVVDIADYHIFREILGICNGQSSFNPKADYDEDGCVSYRDYRIWYGHYLDYSE